MQLRDHLSLFRPFVSPSTKFHWTPELDEAFADSKAANVEAIKHGVEIFDPKKKTCLRPDWSNKGVGYFLLQKHCRCASGLPSCCPDGWKVTLAGSRFLQDAEKRYAPIEGEALAVAWALEQTSYFTMVCDVTKLLGDCTLDEIPNTPFFRLKQRMLPWYFQIVHLPGRSNNAADATS